MIVFCIGTTKKDTPDKEEYRRVEYNIPVNVAKIAKANSVKSFTTSHLLVLIQMHQAII